jgi:hypothetical protein
MTANFRRMAAFAVAVLLMAPASWAQTPVEDHPWGRTTALFGAGGLVVAEDDQGDGWAGGVTSWQMSPRFGLALTALWIDRAGPAFGFGADLSAEIAVFTTAKGHRHFIRLGAGAHRASFDTDAVKGVDWIPPFYRDRLQAGTLDGEATFVDPTLVAGYGVDLRMGTHWALRPEVHVSLTLDGGRSNTMAFAGLQFGYRFTDNPVTPTRSPR